MLGGVLSGVANLTADAYGYQGSPTQNATIAANVMYNVVTWGVVGVGLESTLIMAGLVPLAALVVVQKG